MYTTQYVQRFARPSASQFFSFLATLERKECLTDILSKMATLTTVMMVSVTVVIIFDSLFVVGSALFLKVLWIIIKYSEKLNTFIMSENFKK